MYDPETDADLASLRNIRRHLTVALLAVGQLRRKVGGLPPARRFCSLATDALMRVTDEIVHLEARVLRRQHRDRALPDEFPEHRSE